MTATPDDKPTRSSSRVRAPQVAPVVHGGVRYESLRAPSAEGLPAGVYVSATEVAGGKRLWTAQVWPISIDPRREADVQMVFVRQLALAPSGDRLLVEDERGRKATIELRTGAVHAAP